MDIPQIEKVIASDDMVLKAKFVDGTVKSYNANKLFDPREYPREPDLNDSEIAFFNDISVKIFPTNDPNVLPNVLVSHNDETYRVDIATGAIINNTNNDIPSWMVYVDDWFDQNHDVVKEIWDTGILRPVPRQLIFD